MTEFDPPIMLTFGSSSTAHSFITVLDEAKEDIIWEQLKAEDGSIIVRILNVINLEEQAEREGK